MMLIVALHKFHIQDVVLIIHVEHKGLWIHCSYIFDHFLKLLRQDSELHFEKIGWLGDLSSCKLKEECEAPTLDVDNVFMNFWSSSSYLSKNDVLIVPYDLLLHDLENRDLVIRPCLVTFDYIHYEDYFLCMPNLDKSVKSLVKLFKNLGIDSVGMIETNGNKEFDACVFWRVICFYCMSIKPSNGVGMFYGFFVKDFVSNGLVWVYIVQECLDLCGSPSIAYILRLFEYWHEGYLEGFVLLYYEDNKSKTFHENLV